ncbi:MAG: aminotransferase class V-fold PLP-dependent enzyme, partial [Elusimicrobia bacterium]|nr:aminotransferase class V-fold PLP-dependent enzyme [Elusimicrobiota bacterium]
YLIESIENIPGVNIWGPDANQARTSTVSLTIDGVHPSKAATAFNRKDICVRTGLHCAPGAHRLLGTFPEGSIRISPGFFTSEKDIDEAVKVLKQI